MGDETSDRLERLLGEVRATAGPLAWQRVEELLRVLMDLYGRGLSRLLDLTAPDTELRQRLADDELVASLLALHGLHPLPPETRLRRALDEIAPQLGVVELVALEAGAARLRALDAPQLAGAAELLERLVLETVPEVERVEIEGLRAEPGP